MKKTLSLLIICIFLTIVMFLQLFSGASFKGLRVMQWSGELNVNGLNMSELNPVKSHWLVLKRKSNLEYLYFGEPGNNKSSALLKVFKVKTGIPGERPTPLPGLLNRGYWVITNKQPIIDNPETAPYFLTLNIPVTENPPFGPEPYLECNGQCNWELPGAFGLHGINGDLERISTSNPGSSGCIRHKDEDITYLYNLLDLEKGGIRYYVEDV